MNKFNPEILWKNIYKGIKQRCNNPKNPAYIYYGKRGIKCLITLDEIKKLWFESCAWRLKKPSIDRIDNDGNYEYNNCQFIELSENTRKAVQHKKKPILQFDKQGNFIREWDCLNAIRTKFNYRIEKCLKGLRKSAYNFLWIYACEHSKNNLTEKELLKYKKSRNRQILQFDKNGFFIKKWDYIKQVMDILGINDASIVLCAKGKRKTAGGFIWKYQE